mgnify:CR=1 FL=1
MQNSINQLLKLIIFYLPILILKSIYYFLSEMFMTLPCLCLPTVSQCFFSYINQIIDFSNQSIKACFRLIDNQIKSPLSRRVLFGDLVNGGRVTITIVDNELSFTVEELAKILTKAGKRKLGIVDEPVNNVEEENNQS